MMSDWPYILSAQPYFCAKPEEWTGVLSDADGRQSILMQQ
jgi:hypothetical protein